jgi:hypothetical protein
MDKLLTLANIGIHQLQALSLKSTATIAPNGGDDGLRQHALTQIHNAADEDYLANNEEFQRSTSEQVP